MKQALHIFGKDARRLWPQIAVVVALFSIYGFVSPEAALGKSASLLDWNGIPAALVVLACWTLGAGVIHEDGPADESPFWLTRPYKRTSLVGAKVLFLFAFIFVPLLLTGVVLEIRAGANVFPNAVSLVGLCLLRSLWLILPAVSLGVVTQGLLDFAGALLALWILLLLPEVRGLGTGMILFANDSLLQNASVASILPVTAAGLAAVGLQFARRRTPSSRWLITSGILASAVLLTGDTAEAVSRRIMHPGFDPDQIRITFDRSQTKGRQSQRNRTCSVAPLTVEGLPKNMVLRAASARSEMNWKSYRATSETAIRETADGYSAIVCPPSSFRIEPPTLRTTARFDVIETSPVAAIPVRHGVLDAGGAGRCEVMEDVRSYLQCTLSEPASGVLAIGLEYPGYGNFTRGFGDTGTLRLSPVLRKKFDGVSLATPLGWPLDAALKRDSARFVLRKETVIASVWRTFDYPEFEMFTVPPPKPGKPAQ